MDPKNIEEAIEVGRFIEKLDNLISDFKEHKDEDAEHIQNLYNIGRDLPQKIRESMGESMSDKYVTRDEFHELKITITEVKSSLTGKLNGILWIGGALGTIITIIQIYKLLV